jgi:hypothetical protein
MGLDCRSQSRLGHRRPPGIDRVNNGCVDVYSGYIEAAPCNRRGHAGAKLS